MDYYRSYRRKPPFSHEKLQSLTWCRQVKGQKAAEKVGHVFLRFDWLNLVRPHFIFFYGPRKNPTAILKNAIKYTSLKYGTGLNTFVPTRKMLHVSSILEVLPVSDNTVFWKKIRQHSFQVFFLDYPSQIAMAVSQLCFTFKIYFNSKQTRHIHTTKKLEKKRRKGSRSWWSSHKTPFLTICFMSFGGWFLDRSWSNLKNKKKIIKKYWLGPKLWHSEVLRCSWIFCR